MTIAIFVVLCYIAWVLGRIERWLRVTNINLRSMR